jgi:transcriptional regulator with XRE-family HTH domain
MAGIDQIEREYNESLCKRLREARETRGLTQEQMADVLNIPKERYKKYEGRSPLPPYLFEKVSIITACDLVWLVTGKRSRRPSPTRP